MYIYRVREQLYSAKFKEHACTPGFLFVLSQSLLHLSGNACEYLWNKVEVAKVFELTKKILNLEDVFKEIKKNNNK